MTKPNRRSRSAGSLRAASAWVMVPRLLIAAVLWLMIGAPTPWPGGWIVLAVMVAGTVAAKVAEPVMVRLLWWARTPDPRITILGDPTVTVLVTSTRSGGVAIAGRHHLVVPVTWLNRPGLPTALGQARRRQLVSAGRFDVAYRWLSLPWQLVASFATGFGHGMRQLPLVGFAWTIRPLVTGIAIVQTVAAQRYASAAIIGVVIGLTYLLPWTLKHETAVADAAAGAIRLASQAGPKSDESVPRPRGTGASRHDRRPRRLPDVEHHRRIAARSHQLSG